MTNIANPVVQPVSSTKVLILDDNVKLVDSKGANIATAVAQHVGKHGAEITLTDADGQLSNASCTVTADAQRNLMVQGKYNGSPFSVVIGADGKFSSIRPPANVKADDRKFGLAVLQEANGGKSLSAMRAAKQPGGKPVPQPMGRVGCALAIAACIAAGWELGPLSGSIAIHTLVWECFIAD